MSGLKHRVLVVDDEAIIRNVMVRIVTPIVEKVEVVNSGDEALSLLAKKGFDLVILDVVMPGISGLEVLEKIREQNYPAKVLMMTAYSAIKSEVDAVEKGADGYLSKPFSDISEVRKTILKLLSK